MGVRWHRLEACGLLRFIRPFVEALAHSQQRVKNRSARVRLATPRRDKGCYEGGLSLCVEREEGSWKTTGLKETELWIGPCPFIIKVSLQPLLARPQESQTDLHARPFLCNPLILQTSIWKPQQVPPESAMFHFELREIAKNGGCEIEKFKPLRPSAFFFIP